MDNPEYTFQILEVFSKMKPKEIPRELEEYITYVARTGDPVFQWALVKVLIKEKLVAVLNDFKENNPSLEIPPYPNVDPFNYETLKSNLLTRLDSFSLPPFTIQRICELLSAPRKEYNRIDKYMRAVEKNVLVVSACDLSLKRGLDTDGNESMMNGMLYDKVNDSMNNFSNHVFSTSHDSNVEELQHLSGKLDVPESDAVQQILDDSWTSETGDGDEFKINEANSSTSISVSLDNELQFVTEKSTPEKADVDVVSESKPIEQTSTSSSSSFDDNDSLLMETSLQNIMVDNNTSITYENSPLKSPPKEPTINDEQPTITECENVVFSFNQTQSEDSNQDTPTPPSSNEPTTLETEEKQSFDVTEPPQQPDVPQADSLEAELISPETETFVQTVDKDSSTELQTEDQYKPVEASFEYEDFSSQSTKSDTSIEYTFETESEPPKPEPIEETPSTEESTSEDQLETSTVEIEQPEPAPVAAETESNETESTQVEEEDCQLDESLCSGDNEAQKSSTDSKESDIPAHGEIESVEQSDTTSSSNDKFEDSVPPEGNP